LHLIDFWQCLPGSWSFEREISNGLHQAGNLNVTKINNESYEVCEHGWYVNNLEQTFFRSYNFFWNSDAWHIHGANPKSGYVFLYKISNQHFSCVHHCGSDNYLFELLEFSQYAWKSATTITGPCKNLEIITNYRLTKN
jgi:hypothetical protein